MLPIKLKTYFVFIIFEFWLILEGYKFKVIERSNFVNWSWERVVTIKSDVLIKTRWNKKEKRGGKILFKDFWQEYYLEKLICIIMGDEQVWWNKNEIKLRKKNSLVVNKLSGIINLKSVIKVSKSRINCCCNFCIKSQFNSQSCWQLLHYFHRRKNNLSLFELKQSQQSGWFYPNLKL